MPLFATVQPGVTVASTTTIDASVLNRLGTPSVDIVGEVDGTGSVTIASGTVTNAMMANMTGPTLKGLRTGTAAPTDVDVDNSTIEIGNTGTYGTVRIKDAGITTVKLATATDASTGVTYAKMQQVAASSLIGNPTGSLAAPTGITLGSGLAFSGTTLGLAAAGLSVRYVGQGILTTSQAIPTGSETPITNLSVAVTPASVSSKILLLASINGSVGSSTAVMALNLKRGSTAIAQSGAASPPTSINATSALGIGNDQTKATSNTSIIYVDSPATTSSTTYTVAAQAYISAGTINAPFDFSGSPTNCVCTSSTLLAFEIL